MVEAPAHTTSILAKCNLPQPLEKNGTDNRIMEISHPLVLSHPITLTPGKRYIIGATKNYTAYWVFYFL